MSCASTVAKAAPFMPQLNTPINITSKIIFKIQPAIKKYSGVLLLPNERIKLAEVLFIIVANIPMNIMLKNTVAISSTSGGVCNSSSIGRAIATPITVVIKATTALSTVQAAALFFTPCASFAPKRCPVQIVSPVVKPNTNPSIRNIRQPLHPTAANALTPKKRPTSSVSLSRYIC